MQTLRALAASALLLTSCATSKYYMGGDVNGDVATERVRGGGDITLTYRGESPMDNGFVIGPIAEIGGGVSLDTDFELHLDLDLGIGTQVLFPVFHTAHGIEVMLKGRGGYNFMESPSAQVGVRLAYVFDLDLTSETEGQIAIGPEVYYLIPENPGLSTRDFNVDNYAVGASLSLRIGGPLSSF